MLGTPHTLRTPSRTALRWSVAALALAVALLATLLSTSAVEASTVRVATTGNCLNLRAEPHPTAAVVECIPNGALIAATGESEVAEGLHWLQVSVDSGALGWVAAEFLTAVSNPTEAPSETPGAATATALSPFVVPPPGGMTIGLAGVSSPSELAAAQPFPVAGISMLDPATQSFLLYIVGAPAFANSLDEASLRPDSVVMIRRAGELDASLSLETAAASVVPVVGTPRALPEPPRGGLTQGIAGTNDLATLVAAQPFAVDLVLVLEPRSQHWFTYIPGAPEFVNTLDRRTLQPHAVVTMRRSEQMPELADALTSAAPAPEQAQPAAGLVTVPGGVATVTFYYCVSGPERGAIGDGGGWCGHMASGAKVYAGAAACARANMGQRFVIVGDPTGRVYTCEDTGGRVHGNHRDIWFETSDEARAWRSLAAPDGTAPIEIVVE